MPRLSAGLSRVGYRKPAGARDVQLRQGLGQEGGMCTASAAEPISRGSKQLWSGTHVGATFPRGSGNTGDNLQII